MTPTGNWIASMMGVGRDELWSSPLCQLDGAAWLMKRLLMRYGSWEHALAVYRAGAGSLVRWLDPRDALTPFDETVRYVQKVMGLSFDEVRATLSRVEADADATAPAARPGASTCGCPSRHAAIGPVSMPALAFDPKTPFSPLDTEWPGWTCALHTMQQALEAVGTSMSYADLYHLIVEARGLADADLGFSDHTGQVMAHVFRALGYQARAEYPVDFDHVWEDAGHAPICLSIDGHNQWLFVRSRVDEDTLGLSNSAPGYLGVDQTLTRWQWAQIGGGAAAVHIDVPEGEDPSVIAALQARLVELSGINQELARQVQERDQRLIRVSEGLAHVTDDIVPAIVTSPNEEVRRALAEEAYEIRETRVGPRPAGVAA